MSTATVQFRMPKPVRRKVRLLRWLVRGYICIDGLAAIVLVVGLAFWIGLAIDWCFEPSPVVRQAMWLATALAVVYAAFRYLLGPLTARLSNTNLALLLERNFPDLSESVITTVEADDRRSHSPVGNERLLDNTSQLAATLLRGLKLRQVFRFRPLFRKLGLATALLVSIAAFNAMQSETFAFWMQRMQLDEQPWPRRAQLSVSGFQEVDGELVVNVARDDDFQLNVSASMLDGHEAPEQVEIRYRLADGRRGRDTMTRIGSAVPGRDESQLFRYQFNKVSADLEFDVVGDDARLTNLRLRVVERPQIFRMVLECEFPAYLDRSPQGISVSGRVEIPEGTRAICRLQSSKPLQSVRVHDPAMQSDLPDVALEGEDEVSFSVAVDQVDRILLITLLDQDGVSNREPYRVVLSSLSDQPPEVSVQLRGIGSAVTPQAKIPFAGQISDEYGLQEAWFEYQQDKAPPEVRPLAEQNPGTLKLRDIGELDLAVTNPDTNRPLIAAEPGQTLTLSVKARDAYNLTEQGHVGSSQRFMLDVVTDSELRAILEKKELALRQRFESIYEKMTGSRELLDRIDTKLHATPAGQEEAETARLRERDRLRVNGALQNVIQLSHETLGVADGFESIVGELINNRVNSEELTERLQNGIANPLQQIGGELMPQLEQEMQLLQTSFGDPTKLQQTLTASKLQGDAVLDAMKQVLDRMLELESYNELVELLRGIVADQQQLQNDTKQKRRDKLRSLLED